MASASEKIYAEALFSLALEKDEVKEIYSDLTMIREEIDKDLIYLRIFDISSVSKEEKRNLILSAFETYVSETVCDFLCLLIDKGRFKLFPTIVKHYRELFNRHYNMVDVVVTTSYPLDSVMRSRVIQKIKELLKKEIILHEKVDKEILGGIVVEFNGIQIDVSAKREIENLKNYIKAVTF